MQVTDKGPLTAYLHAHGGSCSNALADFYIGVHAALRNLTLLTHDERVYRNYFPRLSVVAP